MRGTFRSWRGCVPTRTGILANESSWQERDVVDCLRHGAADVISLDQQMLGEPVTAPQSGEHVRGVGLSLAPKHSFGELGIATAAAMHVIATSSNFLFASRIQAPGLCTTILFSSPDLKCKDGSSWTLPFWPGLGVEVDRAKLGALNEAFERERIRQFAAAFGGETCPRCPGTDDVVRQGGRVCHR